MHSIINVLDKHKIPYVHENNSSEIKIKCISGEHEDTNPSMRFNLDKNMFHCFSCGFGGSYAKLLKTIGETEVLDLDTKQPYKLRKLKSKLYNKFLKEEIKLPKDMLLYTHDFKGINKQVISKFKAFTTQSSGFSDYLCFPIYQFGKLRFIEGRFKILNITSNTPKYFRQPSNEKINDIVFPIDNIEDKSHLIIVEGLFDMLNLWQHGYKNAVCIFGTNNFGKEKLEVLNNFGLKKATIFMDNDVSGNKAAKKISEMLESKDIETVIITPPDSRDPGDLNALELKNLFGESYEYES